MDLSIVIRRMSKDVHAYSLARDEQLVAQLHRLGVEHLARLQPDLPCAPLSPVHLITELAAHSQARFRSSLILLFLRRPSFSQFIPETLTQLDLSAALFSRREFHISEFNALCRALIEFSIFTEQYHSARIWFDTWAKPDPNNPKLDFYRGLLQKAGA